MTDLGSALLQLVLIFFKDELTHILYPYSSVLWNVNESRFHKMMPNIRPQFKTIKHTVEMYNTNFSPNDKLKLQECIFNLKYLFCLNILVHVNDVWWSLSFAILA